MWAFPYTHTHRVDISHKAYFSSFSYGNAGKNVEVRLISVTWDQLHLNSELKKHLNSELKKNVSLTNISLVDEKNIALCVFLCVSDDIGKSSNRVVSLIKEVFGYDTHILWDT